MDFTVSPTVGTIEGRNKQIALRLPADEFDKIAAEAVGRGMSMSRYLRTLVRVGRRQALASKQED
jgi:predicted DNA binding CopG/RHH family protein